jgi:hypothetical protein
VQPVKNSVCKAVIDKQIRKRGLRIGKSWDRGDCRRAFFSLATTTNGSQIRESAGACSSSLAVRIAQQATPLLRVEAVK